MDLKILKEFFTFTKKSLFSVFLALLSGIIYICVQIGFETEVKQITSVFIILGLCCLYIIYLIAVLWSYYHLNRSNDKLGMGVLLFIDTHGNLKDYKTIKEKFGDRFKDLSKEIKESILNPHFLSPKKIEIYRKYNNKDDCVKLLDKTNCLFGVFMRATDYGENNNNYELRMEAAIKHPHLNERLHNAINNNFKYIFKDLHIKDIDKNNDLKNLQDIGTKMYYICQLIFGVANSYSGFNFFAIKLYNTMLMNLLNENTKFYTQLKQILHYEICGNACAIALINYQKFILTGEYDAKEMLETTLIMSKSVNSINENDFKISYHTIKSIYNLIAKNNILEAEGEINFLENKFKNIPLNKKGWLYSKAFIRAYKDNPKDYEMIGKDYEIIKNNSDQDPKMIFDFINQFSYKYPDNLGLRLALFWIVYYREELSRDMLPVDFKLEIINDLKNKECFALAKSLELLND